MVLMADTLAEEPVKEAMWRCWVLSGVGAMVMLKVDCRRLRGGMNGDARGDRMQNLGYDVARKAIDKQRPGV